MTFLRHASPRALQALAIAFAVAAVATGCTTAPPAPRVERVEIPVAVPCQTATPPRPAWHVDALPVDADVWTMMATLRAERAQRRAYEIQLETALYTCRAPLDVPDPKARPP